MIANPSFGFHVAAEGSGFTWAMNSRENQLTPWSNDPVTDRPGEALYLKDEENGEVWGPTVAPTRDALAAHCARHGQGYSRFEHESRGIALDLLMYVPLEDPIKISRLKIRNTSGRTRRVSVTAYVEWVLGTSRAACAPFIVTELDSATGALFARNPWHTTFGSRVAFMDLGGRQTRLDGRPARIPGTAWHARATSWPHRGCSAFKTRRRRARPLRSPAASARDRAR